MVSSNIFFAAHKSGSHSAQRFYAGHAVRPASSQPAQRFYASHAVRPSSSQSVQRCYAGHAVRPSSCQQLPLLLVVFLWLFGFLFQVPGKYSIFLSEGVFSCLPTYCTKPSFIAEGVACDRRCWHGW